jgi:L-methionine (R)-S-oxide reductase
MHTIESIEIAKHTQNLSKPDLYMLLGKQAAALLEGEPDMIANFANVASLLWMSLDDINWAGFYLYKHSNQLVLGPFHGKPACVRIALGKGVCGTAAERRETLVVRDVEAFPGHIACDAASRSEIVVPMVKDGKLVGVLDVDSPSLSRFDDADKQGLERLVEIILAATDVAEATT